MIGQAVKDYVADTGSAKLDDVVLIGIAAYGAITGNDTLRYRNKEEKAEKMHKTTKVRDAHISTGETIII